MPIHTRPSAIPAAKTPEDDTADDNMNGGDIETPEDGGDVPKTAKIRNERRSNTSKSNYPNRTVTIQSVGGSRDAAD